MNEIHAATTSIISYWNDFAEKHGYPPQEKNNDAIRKKVRSRIYSEHGFLLKVPYYFEIIHKNCGGKNEFGNKLNLLQFLRAATILRALMIEQNGAQNG